MGFRKTRPGKMGILSIPQGTRIYRREDGGATFERAKKDFNILAMPTNSSDNQPAYSIKLYDKYWYVLKGDIPGHHDD